jgi:hypothetical protein
MTLTQDGFTSVGNGRPTGREDRMSDADERRLAMAKVLLKDAMEELMIAVRFYNSVQHDRTLDIEAISNVFHDEIGEL